MSEIVLARPCRNTAPKSAMALPVNACAVGAQTSFCARHAKYAELRVRAGTTTNYVKVGKDPVPVGQRNSFFLLQSPAVYALDIGLMCDVTRLCQPHYFRSVANAETLRHGSRGLND